MNIKTKLVLNSAISTVIALTAVTLVVGIMAVSSGRTALENQARNQLISIRDTKKGQIEDYFKTVEAQVQTFANDRMMIDAMQKLGGAYRSFRSEGQNNDIPKFRASLGQYYNSEFGPQFRKKNDGASANTGSMLSGLNENAIALQYRYIAANPNPLGSKDKLNFSNDGTTYSQIHRTYHPHIQDFLNKFGFYDIFLVDNSGNVVYSVFKELDFATSLRSGPYANSGLAKAYNKVASAGKGTAVLTDFDPYLPSYMDPASFIASPIVDNGQRLGTLIFQMPIDRINQIMTHNKNWKQAGLGNSGETYLIGKDLKMRSMSRFIVEDKAGYLKLMRDSGVDSRTIKLMDAKETSIGLQAVDTKGTRAAASGQTSYEIFPDYRNIPVLSAYGPINIKGLDWAIMSEIDEEEAFAPVAALRNQIIASAATIYVIILIGASLFAVWFSSFFVKPITIAAEGLRAMANGDLTQRFKSNSKDELGEMINDLNAMAESLSQTVGEVQFSSSSITSASREIASGNASLSQRTEEQASSLEETASSMEEMTGTVKQNADSASEAKKLADANRERAAGGAEVVTRTVQAMSEINASSTRIADIIGTIDGIAFQTNLLALNAAVEAARAGEQGRGFAVVASEVRSLAQRSADAAKEIKGLIEDSVGKVQAGTKLVDESGKTLEEIIDGTQKVADIIAEIAAASIEQASGIDQVNNAVTQMDNMTQDNAALVEEAAAAARSLEEQAINLDGLMGYFKLDGQQNRLAGSNGNGGGGRVSNAISSAAGNGSADRSHLEHLKRGKAKPSSVESTEWEQF